jgi:hypothetical protein
VTEAIAQHGTRMVVVVHATGLEHFDDEGSKL